MSLIRWGKAPIVAFNVGNDAGAASYLAFCNANNPDIAPGAIWAMPDVRDAKNRRIVAFLGPGTGAIINRIPGEEAACIAAGGLLEYGIWVDSSEVE